MEKAFLAALETLPEASRVSAQRDSVGCLVLSGPVPIQHATQLNILVDRFVQEHGSSFGLTGQVCREGLKIQMPKVKLGDVTSKQEREVLAEHTSNPAYLDPRSEVVAPAWNVDFVQASDRRYERHIRPVYEEDSAEALDAVAAFAASVAQRGRGLVVHTGAGISATAGIATYREGVANGVGISAALPTYAHFALVALAKLGAVDYVCSQNVDGLHRRSGLPAEKLSELHGNCFIETCCCCSPPMEFLRPYDVCPRGPRRVMPTDPGVTDNERASGISHITGRKCPVGGGPLRDSVIHFRESLPERALREGQRRSSEAILNLVLGSSLLVTPAADLPFKGGAPVVIVTRSCTGRDASALRRGGALLRAGADLFVERLMWHFGNGLGGWLRFQNTPGLMQALHDRVRQRDQAVLQTNMQVPYTGGADGGVVPLELLGWAQHLQLRQTHEADEEDGWHLWSLSVEPATGQDLALKQVASVSFELHPTFSPSSKVIEQPPFSTGRLKGWGTFNVKVKVTGAVLGPEDSIVTTFPLSFSRPETVLPLVTA